MMRVGSVKDAEKRKLDNDDSGQRCNTTSMCNVIFRAIGTTEVEIKD